jgi:hypothetical protein
MIAAKQLDDPEAAQIEVVGTPRLQAIHAVQR